MERLSMMTEMTPDRILAAETALRLDVINSTVNIDTRLVKLYELVENDLLGALALSSHYISPYKERPGLCRARGSSRRLPGRPGTHLQGNASKRVTCPCP